MLPASGDIAWIELDPVLGTEQAGRRPALVLTSDGYHERSPRAVICPITSNARDWPFNVPLPPGMKTRGVVLVDQVRSVQRDARFFRLVEKAPENLMGEVRARLASLLGIDSLPAMPPVVR